MPFTLSNLADVFNTFFSNYIILSALTSWFMSQLLKAIITILRIKKRTFKEVIETLLWSTGGMPSSHTAVVISMSASVAYSEGVGSNLFTVSLLLALVVMRDAMGVRRAVGLQARTLNMLGRYSEEKFGTEFRPLKEIQGHAPLEVIIGALLGVFIAAAYAWL
jgi:acid phosphatase family membrane protein YuiD